MNTLASGFDLSARPASRLSSLKATTALGSVVAVMLFATPAFAANECGAATNSTVTCHASGNPYAGGITYMPTASLTLATDSDVMATNTIDVRGVGTTHVTNNGTIATTGAGSTFSAGADGIIASGTTGTIVDGMGAISTSGLNARGIDASSTGGDVTVNVGDVTTTGTGGGGPGFFPNSSAIFANTDAGAISVTAGTLKTAGDFAAGVQAISNTGDITVNTGAITTTGNNANGVLAQTYGTGTAAVTSTGTISTSGQAANGVAVYAGNGTATVNVQDVNATGFNAAGILASGGTAANATFGSITTAGSFGQGVVAQSGGDVTVSGTNVTTSGVDAAGIYAFSDTGNASVTTTGTIATTGASSRGVYAYSNSGDANVSVNNVTTTGNNSGAVVAQGANATVTVTGNVSTQGTAMYSPAPMNGVMATATDGDAKVTNNGTITTNGNNSSAIVVSGTNSATVDGTGSAYTNGNNSDAVVATSAGDVSVAQSKVGTTGDYSRGVVATSTGAGNVDVNVDTVTTSGTAGSSFFFLPNSAGIVATANTGNVTVTNKDVTTAGMSATGIRASSYSGDVTVNAGNVTTTGGNAVGIQATGNYGGNVVVTSTGTVSTAGDGAIGIYGTARQGDVTVNAGDVSTGGFNSAGIRALGGTSSTVSANNVTTAGAFSAGIDAEATGDVNVAAGNVSTGAVDSAGIYAFSDTGNATVTSTGTIATTAASSTGVYAYSGTGDAAVTVKNVSTAGNDSNAVIATGANASVTINGNVSTQGMKAYSANYADAVNVTATNGTATVVNDGAVSTAGDNAFGISAYGTQGVAISGTGTVSTAGYNAIAVDASALAGPVSVTTGNISTMGDGADGIRAQGNGAVTVNAGNVTTAGGLAIGVEATGLGTDPVSVTTGAVKTSGDNASGILAYSGGGSVTINAGSAATTGANAVGVQGRGAGPVSITTGTASSASREAVYAGSFTDAATVTLNGATSGTGGNAVFIAAATDATLNLGANGSLTQAGGNADILAGGTATVNNAGTIAGDGTAPIINVFNATPLTFNSSGTFTGTIGFATGSDDTVNNSGVYNAKYDQDFGTGTDTFSNSGTFNVLPGAAAAGTVHLTGLEAFNNSGLVDLRNGHAGDMLDTSSTFTGSGNSTLGIDVAFGTAGGASTSDQLNAAGAITGSTGVIVNPVGANGAILNSGTVFATGGAGSSAGAFGVAAQSANQGFIHYGVTFNAANNSYSLVGTPGDAVFRTLKINEGAQQLWYKSADAWSSHMSDLRDAKFAGGGADGGRIWGQFYGGTVTRRDGGTDTTFGQSRAVNLSYKQDAYGFQLGMDLGSRDMGSGNVVFGVTGGYLNSDLTFRNSADRVNYSVANAGLYASYVSGSLFANVLGKYDYYWINSKSPLAGYTDKFHGMSYGVQGEVGFRLGGDSFYAEPVATIAYVRTDLKDIHALGSTIDFDNLDGLRGKAGVRIGSKMDMGGNTAVIYAQGNYVHEFKGKDGIDFINGGQSLDYRNDRLPDYGEAKIGFNVTTPGGVTGFVEGFGEYAKHGDYKGGGGRAGIRIKF